MLVSVWGKRWREVVLVNFTLYLDDSGTSPSQRIALANALVIPAAQLVRMSNEWESFRKKESFSAFHTSECMAKNHKSIFADWSDEKQKHVFSRIRQISKKYGSFAVSYAINKEDYESAVPDSLKKIAGKFHYTWALRNVIAYIHRRFSSGPQPPFEYIFDCMGKPNDPRRVEVESVMCEMEEISAKRGNPGRYVNYSFRRREDVPGLQCVDSIAWTCYQYSIHLNRGTPLHRLTPEAWQDYGGHLAQAGWLKAISVTREHLQDWAKREIAHGASAKQFEEWQQMGTIEKRRIEHAKKK